MQDSSSRPLGARGRIELDRRRRQSLRRSVLPFAKSIEQKAMPRISAGILLFRRRPTGVEVLLVHPGGPFWAKKDAGAWSIPKGEVETDEDLLVAARREVFEETGLAVGGECLPLGAVKQPGGKTVVAFAREGEFDPASLRSNTFAIEWPPRSGKTVEFPEVDRAEWFDLPRAGEKILKGQQPILANLAERVGP
jgi:predicted NUDIX family NTP pyrophosphohydrolase